MDRIEVIGVLHKVDNQIKRKIDQVALKHDLTGIQAFFLKCIHDKSSEGDLFQRDLEKMFDIRRSSVSTMISCVEKKGYIKRVSIPTDKRVNKIILTEEGMKKHEEVDADLKKYKQELLKDFSDEEIKLLYNILERISDSTKKNKIGGHIMEQTAVRQEQPVQRENKMGTMPVDKLLLSMALPMVVSMLVQALYNIVDSVFVAQLSENALTAVSMAFPVQNLMIGLATGIGVGMNAFVSKNLGQHNQEGVNKSALHGIFLEFINYLIFLCIGLFAVQKFMQTQTNISDIVESGTTYLRIVCICSFGIFTQVAFERLLQSTGKTLLSMTTQLTGAIINIILDPILIFGLFGMPKLGIAGAAIATVIGQIVAGTFAVILNLKKNKEIHLHLKGFRLEKEYLGRILYVGIPSVLMVAIGSVMSYGMNLILMTFSSTAVAVFGAYYKLQSFVFMPIFGLNNGMVPIVSFNLGAKNKDRLVKTVKLGVCYAVGIMLIGLVIIQAMPGTLLKMFNASEQMLIIGIPALRIISVSFVFAGFSIIASSTFQALGNGILSMLVSFVRQLVFLLPAAFILSKFGNVDLVWLSFPIAEVASVIMSAISLKYLYNKVVKDL